MARRILALLFFLWALPAVAQEREVYLDLPDEFVVRTGEQIRANLHKLKISDTEFVAEETPEELAVPILNEEEIETVLVRGIISSTAEWCGYDWGKKSFEPFMREQRGLDRTDKQMAYIGGLHGYGMSIMQKVFSEKECDSPSIRKKLLRYLY